MKNKILPISLSILLFLFLSKAGAVSVVEMDLQDLAEYAETIVIGKVADMESAATERGIPSHIIYHFMVEKVIKGGVNGDEISFKLRGGEANGFVLNIPGMPRLNKGVKYLLFLNSEKGKDIYCPILGWWQGKFEVAPDEVAGKEIVVCEDGQKIASIQGGKLLKSLKAEDSGLSLPNFVEAIKSIIDRPGYRDKSFEMNKLQKDLLEKKRNRILSR